MRLFVDDWRRSPEGWHLARTVTEAIRVLATVPVHMVSLDHDITYQGRHGIELETFEGVAWYIAAMVEPPEVIIHTANPSAAIRMAQILKDVGIDATIAEAPDERYEGEV